MSIFTEIKKIKELKATKETLCEMALDLRNQQTNLSSNYRDTVEDRLDRLILAQDYDNILGDIVRINYELEDFGILARIIR